MDTKGFGTTSDTKGFGTTSDTKGFGTTSDTKGGGGGVGPNPPRYLITQLTQERGIFVRYRFILECFKKGKVDQISFICHHGNHSITRCF